MQSKIKKVSTRLEKKGSITSIQAFELFKATRLSAIIFILRKRGWNIDSKEMKGKDDNGKPTRFVKYIFISKPVKPNS